MLFIAVQIELRHDLKAPIMKTQRTYESDSLKVLT